MEKTFRKDISDKKEFDRNGYHYTQILADDEKKVYLYEMTPIEWEKKYDQYELVKGKRYKNPDGEIVYIYPSDEDFGTYGWYICGTTETTKFSIEQKWLALTGYSPYFTL